MTAEMATMQRVTDALREENGRLLKKGELLGELSNQRMQEIGGLRR
jgi:chromosome segregation ATPase